MLCSRLVIIRFFTNVDLGDPPSRRQTAHSVKEQASILAPIRQRSRSRLRTIHMIDFLLGHGHFNQRRCGILTSTVNQVPARSSLIAMS